MTLPPPFHADLPDEFTDVTDATGAVLPRSFTRLCRLFALRALVDLGGMFNVVHDGHCSAPELLRFVRAEPDPDADDFDPASVMAKLRARHRVMSERKPCWPEGNPMMRNARWLQARVGLTETELHLMLLCVLARHHPELGQALDSVGGLAGLHLTSAISTLLDTPMAEVSSALSADSALASSGLVKVDENATYPFLHKLDLLMGLEQRLQTSHDNPFNLFADNFVVAPAPTLQADRFDHLQPKLNHILQYLRHAVQQGRTGVNILIWGPPGTGKTEVVRTLAAAIQAELFEVSVSRQCGHRIEGMQRVSAYALSQKILARRGGALIMFDEIEDISGGSDDDDDFMFPSRSRKSGNKAWMNQMLETNPVPAVWVSNRITQIDAAHLRRFDYHLEMDTPPAAVRTRMLVERAGPLGASEAWCRQMATNDCMGPGVMARAASVAGAMREAGVTTPVECLLEELIGGSLSAQRLQTCAKPQRAGQLHYRIDVTHASSDLAALVAGLRRQPQARLCLYGPPGTGKSAFAQHLAEQLGMPAMLQRASDIVSALVGETEQQMAAMFRRAKEDNAVLILDEADSFLMSRQGARQSWEVSSVNEMLTQMESFEGIFVATTNLMDRLDEASLRRFDAKIAFDYLRPGQIVTLLQEACAVLGLDATGSQAQASQLRALTPGDFATVIRQARFSPVRDLADLGRRLADETRMKSVTTSRPMGFVLQAA